MSVATKMHRTDVVEIIVKRGNKPQLYLVPKDKAKALNL